MTSNGRAVVHRDSIAIDITPTVYATPGLTGHSMVFRGCPEGCPPTGAVAGPKELFRLVKNDPPLFDDFLTSEETGKHQDKDACIRCSISTFNNQKNAERLRKDIPYFRRHMVAAGVVPVEAGLMKRTLSTVGHWSWWPTAGYLRHSPFKVVA